MRVRTARVRLRVLPWSIPSSTEMGPSTSARDRADASCAAFHPSRIVSLRTIRFSGSPKAFVCLMQSAAVRVHPAKKSAGVTRTSTSVSPLAPASTPAMSPMVSMASPPLARAARTSASTPRFPQQRRPWRHPSLRLPLLLASSRTLVLSRPRRTAPLIVPAGGSGAAHLAAQAARTTGRRNTWLPAL